MPDASESSIGRSLARFGGDAPVSAKPANVARAELLDQLLHRAERVVGTWCGDEFVLMDGERDRYYTLNRTGGRIWDMLAVPASVDSLAARLGEEFEASAGRSSDAIQTDVLQLIGSLLRAGLIVGEPGCAESRATVPVQGDVCHAPAGSGGSQVPPRPAPIEWRPSHRPVALGAEWPGVPGESQPVTSRNVGPLAVIRCMVSIARIRRSLSRRGLARTLQEIARTSRRVERLDRSPAAVAEADRAVALAAALYPGRALCLERSLALYARLRKLGVDAELCLGVQATPFAAHAWVTSYGAPLNDTVEHIERFHPMPSIAP